MSAAGTFYGRVNEDGSASVLARVVGLDGTGTEQAPGEGPVLKVADVSAVSCRVYDLGTNKDASSGTEVTPAPALTPAANLLDVLRTAGWPTPADPYGYNFRHDVSPAYFPTGGDWYLLEYKFTLTTGAVLFGRCRVKATDEVES